MNYQLKVFLGYYFYQSYFFKNYCFKVMGKLKIWGVDQDQILRKVCSYAKSKKWKKASQELNKMGFSRTDVECRQRYINHLDPRVNKESWSDQELQILYSKYSQYGNKWFLLQKHLPGRTQTKIKNYFYGRIRFFLKLIVKICLAQNTGFISDIKTETLLEIYEGKGKFTGYTLIQKTIKRLKYKIQKKSCIKFIKENKEPFQQFANYFYEQCFAQGAVHSQGESQSSESEQNQNSNIPEAVEPTKICLVSSIAGIPNNRQEEAEYLKKMAETHLKLYNHYQQVFQRLKHARVVEEG